MANRFNLEYDIPQNRIVEIRNSNGLIFPQPLILDEEVSIKVKSNYGQLWEASPNNFLNLLSSSTSGKIASGQFALQGAQIWQSTDPIDIDVKVSLQMDKDPFEDVIAPAFTLMQTCVPSMGEMSKFVNDFVEEKLNLKLKTLIPPGPNLQTLLNLMKNDKEIGNNLLDKGGKERGIYNVKVGFVKFNNVIIKSVDPTFSKTVAPSTMKNGKLLPVSVDLSISMCTMEVATTNMLNTVLTSF